LHAEDVGYVSETWAIKMCNMRRLESTENTLVRSMCGVKLKDRRQSVELRERLGFECVAKMVRCGRQGWFGHVE
jgi:L-amino acid N-acyltransferase YncA